MENLKFLILGPFTNNLYVSLVAIMGLSLIDLLILIFWFVCYTLASIWFAFKWDFEL